MKKRIFGLALAVVLVFGNVMTGCSAQTEEEISKSSIQSGQPEETLNSSRLQSSNDSSLIPPEQEEITGALVKNEGNNFVFGSETEVLGTNEDLDSWLKAISERGSVAKLMVSTMNSERDLTPNEIDTILDTLENLSPSVMDELGNPATGGATHVAAFDRSGNRLWVVTLNCDWLIVQLSANSLRFILEIDWADAAPIQNIAD